MHSASTPYAVSSSVGLPLPLGGRWDQPSGFARLAPLMARAQGNGDIDVVRVVSQMGARRKISQGECLYRQQDPFHSVYAVRSGSFKSTLALSDGGEQVSNFHLTGALLGLDGVAEGYHASAATALEDSEVSMVSYSHLTDCYLTTPGMQLALLRQVSSELVRGRFPLVLLGQRNARQRVAGFLLQHSESLNALGYSATEFHLKMSRGDIGSFLGLTLETVSRTFSELQHMHLLKVLRRHVRLFDPQGLAHL